MRALALILVPATLLVSVPRGGMRADTSSSSLYSQSAAQAIPRALAECDTPRAHENAICSQRSNISYLLLDANNGVVLASDWPNPELPIPLGSLVRPYAALAYGEKHGFRYPIHHCRGTA